MKNVTIISCALIILSAGIFLYDLFYPNSEGFFLQNMQVVEGIVFGLYSLIFSSLYVRVIRNGLIHFLSFILAFTLFCSVKYEYDSALFTIVHGICYSYFLAVTAWVTRLMLPSIKV